MLISVVILTYNHEQFIEQAMSSVLNQKGNFNLELIVSNDNSKDSTKEKIQNVIQNNITTHKILNINHTVNLGIVANLKYALDNCNGDFIAFCDGDDYWTDENKLGMQLSVLNKNEHIQGVIHDFDILYKNDLTRFSLGYKRNLIQLKDLIRKFNIQASTLLIRRSIFKDSPDWFRNNLFDTTIYFYALLKGDFFYINKSMSCYRRHSGNVTSNSNNSLISNNFLIMDIIDKETNYRYHKLIDHRTKLTVLYPKLISERKVLKKIILFLSAKINYRFLSLYECKEIFSLIFSNVFHLYSGLKKAIKGK